jgi:hypothetical protein
MRPATLGETVAALRPQEVAGVWWGIGFGLGLLYFVLLLALGITCLRKGHWVMFIAGFFIPLFWIIGAVIPPRRPQTI